MFVRCDIINSMKKTIIFFSIVFAAAGLAADEPSQKRHDGEDKQQPPKIAASKVRIKCAVCAGKGSLKIRPPDVGQFTGKINDRSHWDIKLNPCPACGRGHGWRVVWDLTQPEPSTEPPCMSCGWSGLVQCRKCLASGLMKCPRSDCKAGWIITKSQYVGKRSSYRKPPDVKPCPECKGVGKVVCPECKGLRADLCKRCFGTGRKR